MIFLSFFSKQNIVEMAKLGRAGVIPYVEYEGIYYLCLGRDQERKCYADFGGRIEKNENVYETASRELYEESAGIFYLSPEDIQNRHTGYIKNNYSISFFIPFDMNDLDMEFTKCYFLSNRSHYLELLQKHDIENPDTYNVYKHYLENISIEWFTESHFLEMIHTDGLSPNILGGLRRSIRNVLRNKSFLKMISKNSLQSNVSNSNYRADVRGENKNDG